MSIPSLFTSQMTTLAPSLPKLRAKCAPTPPPPPVINTTCPETSYKFERKKKKSKGNYPSLIILFFYCFLLFLNRVFVEVIIAMMNYE